MENRTIRNNPFFILHASPEDDHSVLQKKAGTAILLEESAAAEKALATLLHPQKRLDAELNWFPQTAPEEIERLLSFSENGGLLPDFQTDSCIALVNGCRCILSCWPSDYSEGLAGIGLCLAGALPGLSEEQVLKELNESRKKSGFPEITNHEMAAAHLQEQRDEILAEFSKRMKDARPEEAAKAAGHLADAYAGTDPLYARNLFLQKMVDAHMLTVADEEEKQKQNIKTIAAAEHDSIERLEMALTDWDRVSSPRRKIRKAQGLTDKTSLELMNTLSVFIASELAGKRLYNRQRVQSVNSLLGTIIKVFWDLPEENLAGYKKMHKIFSRKLPSSAQQQ